MKKAVLIFMALVSVAVTAQNDLKQNRDAKKEFRHNLDPEQKAELVSKKLTLDLNLTDIQQQKVKQLYLDSQTKKGNRVKGQTEMTSLEKFELRKQRMDNKIALKREMKEILTPEQFEKWEKQSEVKKMHYKKGSKRIKQKAGKRN